ncbi:MAG: RNA methyltransferase [Anaerolineales bacterium]
MISSVHSPKVQEIRALQGRAKKRREAGAFVVEGVRLAEEALNSGWTARQALYTENLGERGQHLLKTLKTHAVPAELVSESVMKAASDTQSPQGILLELELRQMPLPARLSLVLILDGVADPGNLGTLLRSAAAAGAEAVLLGPGSSDAFAPKVLRGGMGAHFRLAIRHMEWNEVADLCKERSLHSFLAEAGEGQPYDRVDLKENLAFIIGGEAHGTSQGANALDPIQIHIPMPGRIESLNAAMAGTVLLFEALRQRRAK